MPARRAGGDLRATLELIPMTKPVYARYRALLKADFLISSSDSRPAH